MLKGYSTVIMYKGLSNFLSKPQVFVFKKIPAPYISIFIIIVVKIRKFIKDLVRLKPL